MLRCLPHQAAAAKQQKERERAVRKEEKERAKLLEKEKRAAQKERDQQASQHNVFELGDLLLSIHRSLLVRLPVRLICRERLRRVTVREVRSRGRSYGFGRQYASLVRRKPKDCFLAADS